MRGARIGVARAFFTGFDELDGLIEQAHRRAAGAAGAEIVDPVDLASPTYWDAELRVLLYEMKASLPRYLATFAPGARIKTLADVDRLQPRASRRGDAVVRPGAVRAAEAYGGLDAKEYLDALAECRKLARDEGLDRV